MVKNWIKRALIASNTLWMAAQLRSPAVAILVYHSVMEEPAKEKNTLGAIIHSTTVFRGQMELIARKYNPVSVDEVLQFLKSERDLPSRSVAVTFDDGYADNYEVVCNVLDRIGIPAVFYVTVDCIENAKLPWPSRLRYAFYTTRKTSWTEQNGTTWPLDNFEQRDGGFLKACDDCCQLAGETQEGYVKGVEQQMEVEPPAQSKQLMMTWEQVRALLKKGHSVGSHTMTHPNLAYVGERELYRELANSKRRLQEVLHSRIIHFSYPCPARSPHWVERTVQVSHDLAYETAVTMNLGLTKKGDNPLCIRRVLPTKEVDGLRWNLEYTFARRRT